MVQIEKLRRGIAFVRNLIGSSKQKRTMPMPSQPPHLKKTARKLKETKFIELEFHSKTPFEVSSDSNHHHGPESMLIFSDRL